MAQILEQQPYLLEILAVILTALLTAHLIHILLKIADKMTGLFLNTHPNFKPFVFIELVALFVWVYFHVKDEVRGIFRHEFVSEVQFITSVYGAGIVLFLSIIILFLAHKVTVK